MTTYEQQLKALLERTKKGPVTDDIKVELVGLIKLMRDEEKPKADASKKYSICICPYHAEKTPSFTINRETKQFHCFSCGESGTMVTDKELEENTSIMQNDDLK